MTCIFYYYLILEIINYEELFVLTFIMIWEHGGRFYRIIKEKQTGRY